MEFQTTIRGRVLSEVANLMDDAERINAGRDVPEDWRAFALGSATTNAALLFARNGAMLRSVLMSVAEVALSWVEYIDTRDETRLDVGDGAA